MPTTPETSFDNEMDALLLQLSNKLRQQLNSPSDDSLVEVAAAHNALRKLTSSSASALRVECLLDVAQFFYVSGRTVLGLEPAVQAIQYARQLADAECLRKALTFHGILLADSGNLPAAIECHAEALDIAVSSGSPVTEGVVWNNLGVALLYGAQYSEAIQCFERVIELSELEPELRTTRAGAYSNIALACLHAEDFSRGLRSAQAGIESPPDGSANELLSRVLAESIYSKLLLEVNDLDRAKTRCQVAKEFASRSRSQRAEHAAAIAEGLYEVHCGMVDVGLSRLQNALDQARIMKSALRDALIALVKAYDICGKPQMALVHLRELLHHTKKTQQEKALLHHRMHLERLGLPPEQNELNVAMSASARQAINRDRIRVQWALLHRQAIAAELVEDSSGEHLYRVGKLAALLAADIGLDDDTCFMIEMSARLHDIGKIGVPDAILAKRDSINPEQRALVKTHANIGAELLSQSGLTGIQLAVDVARHHHERWDGDGYPDGIAGAAIPEVSRISALCDVFDVLTHERPYKKAWPIDRALEQIALEKGQKFDPELADRFIALVKRLQTQHPDLDEFLGQEARDNPFIQARRKIARALERARAGLPLDNGLE